MKIRTAVLTGVTGLMLNMGLGSALFAQPVYRNRNPYRNSYRNSYNNSGTVGRYAANGDWQARQVVRQAYRDILQREPDPSGLQSYTDAIVNRGWSADAVRRSLLNSDEYAQRFGSARRGFLRYR
jgi:hypothetical protein